MKKTIFLQKTLPVYLFAALLAGMLVIVFTQASNYGLTTDQAMHVSYGHAVFEWYKTFGRDRSFLNYPAEDYEPQHGAIFDVVVEIAQHIFHHQWYTEAVIIGLSGILGVTGIALCGFELGGWWFALLAALNLWLYPRFFGGIFNNPKDIPFTSANIFVLWSVLRLVKKWGQGQAYIRNSLLVALCVAIAVSIRVTAITWYALLSLMLVGWWLLRLRRLPAEQKFSLALKQQAITCGIIEIGSFSGIMVMWPYIFVNPLVNFYDAVVVNAKYPWNGAVLYEGKMQLATQLPRTFALVWLVIGSPPALILLASIGLLLFGGWCIRKRAVDPLLIVVVLAIIIPLGMIVGLHAVLYNGLRQFLFVVPPIILLAVYGLMQIFDFLVQKKQQVLLSALILLTIGNFAWVAVEMFKLDPYEYVYFSPVVGGVEGANGRYEMDYWNSCQRAASKWLGDHYPQFGTSNQPTIQSANIQFQYLTFLPANFHAVANNPDFLIDIAPFKTQQELSQYKLIHTVSAQGVPLCKVYVDRNAK